MTPEAKLKRERSAFRLFEAIEKITTRRGDNRHTVGDTAVTAQTVADELGVARRTVDRAVSLKRRGHEAVIVAFLTGKISLPQASGLAALPKDEQLEALQHLTGESRRVALYRHYDDEDRLLYVGISATPVERTRGHAKNSRWVNQADHFTGKWYDSWEEAKRAETAAIITEKPLFNITENPEALT
jgi:hypothetical protein